MQLPGVGTQVEGVVLGSLGDPAVHRREHGLQTNWFPLRENGTYGVATEGHMGYRRSGYEASIDL